MSRHFTPEYAEKHNAQRRKKYHSDPEYRDRAVKRARVLSEPDLDVRNKLIHNSENISKFSETCLVVDRGTGKERKLPVMNMDQIAQSFDRQKFVILRWKNEGKFPETNLFCYGYNSRKVQVYLSSEIAAALVVMADHFSETPYYHPSHTETKDKVFEVMLAERKKKDVTTP